MEEGKVVAMKPAPKEKAPRAKSAKKAKAEQAQAEPTLETAPEKILSVEEMQSLLRNKEILEEVKRRFDELVASHSHEIKVDNKNQYVFSDMLTFLQKELQKAYVFPKTYPKSVLKLYGVFGKNPFTRKDIEDKFLVDPQTVIDEAELGLKIGIIAADHSQGKRRYVIPNAYYAMGMIEEMRSHYQRMAQMCQMNYIALLEDHRDCEVYEFALHEYNQRINQEVEAKQNGNKEVNGKTS